MSVQYMGCELSHMEYHTDKTGRAYDMGWCVIFEGKDKGGGRRTISYCIDDNPEIPIRHLNWLESVLKRLNDNEVD